MKKTFIIILSLFCLGWTWDGGWDQGRIPAREVSIKDDGSFYVGSNVEDALQELGAGTAGIWLRDSVNGYLYPNTLADNVGIGTSTPGYQLDVIVGS